MAVEWGRSGSRSDSIQRRHCGFRYTPSCVGLPEASVSAHHALTPARAAASWAYTDQSPLNRATLDRASERLHGGSASTRSADTSSAYPIPLSARAAGGAIECQTPHQLHLWPFLTHTFWRVRGHLPVVQSVRTMALFLILTSACRSQSPVSRSGIDNRRRIMLLCCTSVR